MKVQPHQNQRYHQKRQQQHQKQQQQDQKSINKNKILWETHLKS